MADGAPPNIDWIWFFFRFGGRVNRMAFLLGGLLLGVVGAIPIYRFMLVPPETPEAQFWSLVFSAFLVPYLWSSMALGAKRLHDMGKPGLAAVSLFVPVVSLIAFAVLCLFPGEPGPNQYGRETNAPR